MESFFEIITTVDTMEEAEKIARAVVEKNLVACAQISGPIVSIYRWKGNVEQAKEWRITMKSRKDLYGNIEKTIMSLHPYEVPEIIAIPILEGSEKYLEWIKETTR